jgi:hypothetical protein
LWVRRTAEAWGRLQASARHHVLHL